MKFAFALLLLHSSLFAGANSLSGVVTSSHGVPVAGAALYLEGRQGVQVTVSDLQGAYAFVGLEDGDYQLSAWDAEKRSEAGQISLRGATSKKWDAALSVDAATVSGKLEIRAIKGTAAPISVPLRLEAGMNAAQALEGQAAQAAFKALAGGEYEVVLSRPGLAYVGTCLVLCRSAGAEIEKSVVHTSGMEIAGSDFIQALSEQASSGASSSERL
jgi:hypothetical protein